MQERKSAGSAALSAKEGDFCKAARAKHAENQTEGCAASSHAGTAEHPLNRLPQRISLPASSGAHSIAAIRGPSSDVW